MSVISDKKVGVSAGGVTVDYYNAEVLGQNDYYAFGMMMPGRKYSVANTNYRYGFNGQEKSTEINGSENHYNAEFWEYDSRIGRRWNLDPIYNTDISRYATNSNNPNYYLDPKGDFKTKFGAKWYKLWHAERGEVKQSQTGKRKEEWYITRESRIGKKGDGKELLDEVVISTGIFGPGSKKQRGQGSGDIWSPSIDDAAAGVEKGYKIITNNASDIWNSRIARAIIPDYYTISGNLQTSSGVYVDGELTLTLMLRGKDPGLYFNSTIGGGVVSSAGVDVGCSIGRGYYNGDARDLTSNMLGGWVVSANVGVGGVFGVGGSLNGGVDVGIDENGKKITTTGKVGISAGVGISTPILQVGVGGGKTSAPVPIFKF